MNLINPPVTPNPLTPLGLILVFLTTLLSGCTTQPPKPQIQHVSRVAQVQAERLKPVDQNLTRIRPRPNRLLPGAKTEALLVNHRQCLGLVDQYECQLYAINGQLPSWCEPLIKRSMDGEGR